MGNRIFTVEKLSKQNLNQGTKNNNTSNKSCMCYVTLILYNMGGKLPLGTNFQNSELQPNYI